MCGGSNLQMGRNRLRPQFERRWRGEAVKLRFVSAATRLGWTSEGHNVNHVKGEVRCQNGRIE